MAGFDDYGKFIEQEVMVKNLFSLIIIIVGTALLFVGFGMNQALFGLSEELTKNITLTTAFLLIIGGIIIRFIQIATPQSEY